MALAPSNIVTEMYPPGSDPQPILTGKRAEAVAILKQIPEANEVRFEPIQTDKKRAPKLQIPPYIDIMEPYQIFSLFFTEDLFKVLADNTNMYAYAKLSKNMNPHHRNWRSTTPGELKAFVGAQIYMGFTKEPQLKDYWDEEKHNKSVHANHPLSNYITCFRFEQLKRFFHISEPSEVPGGFISTYYRPEPTEEEELQLSEEQLSGIWWHKVHTVFDILRKASKNLYIPSSNISIDEAMVCSHGRSSHTYKMPNKPISQGFKIFVLADHGYCYYFYPASRTKGVVEVGMAKELTKTGQMVYELVQTLPKDNKTYDLYLDNYFTSVNLFKALREIQVGACGTTRPHKEFPNLLKKLKDLGSYIPYHKVCAIPVNDVLCVAWQDNNIVLALTTIHTVDQTDDYIERTRRRPQKTSTNGPLVHKEFGEQAVKNMPIPRFIDDYNSHMGGVDIANQHRAVYDTHIKAFRSWWPLWNWCLDVGIVNAYKIHSVRCKELGIASLTHSQFRRQLSKSLLLFAPPMARYMQPTSTKKRKTEDLQPPKPQNNTSLPHLVVKSYLKVQKRCIWCLYKNPKRQTGQSPSFTTFICQACDVPLCRPETGRTCLRNFHMC